MLGTWYDKHIQTLNINYLESKVTLEEVQQVKVTVQSASEDGGSWDFEVYQGGDDDDVQVWPKDRRVSDDDVWLQNSSSYYITILRPLLN